MSNYLASHAGQLQPVSTDHAELKRCANEVGERIRRLLSVKGKHGAETYWRRLGKLMWDHVGMARSASSLHKALTEIPEIREEFWRGVSIPGGEADMNLALEQAGRVADFLEFAELLAYDALERDESCGAHFRIEHQYPDGEAKRDDEHFCYVSGWQFTGVGRRPVLHREPLHWDSVHPSVRSYK
jgi:succinate dehydrogenase / fumarate reductase flavoprotein subunit